MNVDMATYKAEFLSHYYEGRLRPRHAYAMGLIYWWARLASLMPGLVNFVTHLPVVGKAFQVLGGISTRRKMPVLRPRDVQGLVAPAAAAEHRPATGHPLARHIQQPLPSRRPPRRRSRCWRTPGFQVVVPQKSLCCGRPLYDFGMLDTAKALLREILDTLRPEIEAGTPDRRPGAELRRGLPRRADELFPDGRGRQAAQIADLHPERVPRKEGPGLPAPASSSARPWSRSTATTSTS